MSDKGVGCVAISFVKIILGPIMVVLGVLGLIIKGINQGDLIFVGMGLLFTFSVFKTIFNP